MNKNLTINIHKKIPFGKRAVKKIVNEIEKDINCTVDSVEINFVGSGQIHKINNKYLGHDYTTDIITFNYSGNNQILDGELFISIEDAEQFASKYNIPVEEELLRLIIHGFLHLAGYNDQAAADKRKMKRLENRLLNRYKFILLTKKNS